MEPSGPLLWVIVQVYMALCLHALYDVLLGDQIGMKMYIKFILDQLAA